MPDNIVNLNRFRKKKLKQERGKLAEQNRAKHGRTKAERQRDEADTARDEAQRQRDARTLEGKRLERDSSSQRTVESTSEVPTTRDAGEIDSKRDG